MTDLEIVQEAQERIETGILRTRAAIALLKDSQLIEKNTEGFVLTLLLAHKAFFERHKRLETYAGDLLCEVCEYSEYRASYPCPESVAQAKAIMGVE